LTALIVGCLVAVVLLLVFWLRVRAARSDRRSMETYGHALGVLGDVAKRTGPSSSVRVLPQGEPGRAHVRTGPSDRGSSPRAASPSGPEVSRSRLPEVERPRSGGAGASAPARAYRWPSVSMPVPQHEQSDQDMRTRDGRDRLRSDSVGAVRPKGARPRAVQADQDAPPLHMAASPATGSSTAEPEIVVGRTTSERASPAELRRQVTVRRLATGACAAVAVGAIALASVLLSGNGAPTAKAPPKSRHPSSNTTVTSTTAVPPTTARPAVIEPISSSGSQVSFQAPAGPYVVSFTTSGGPCWLGVETGVGTGDFIWEDTVQPGTAATYRSSGSLVLDVGAAEYLSLSVNGIPARIPSAITTGYVLFVSR
jgi:hypothetical protein